MDAVIATGGKQYRVSPGQVIRVERLAEPEGSSVEFTRVLLVSGDGKLLVEPAALAGARVVGEVLAHGKARKVTVVKFKRRKNYRRTHGHRQPVTTVRITRVEV